jgi:hypothetical protein
MAQLGVVWRSARQAMVASRPNLYASAKQAASSEYLHQHFDDVPLLILGYGPEGLGSNTVVLACWSMCLAARAEGVGSTYTTLLNSVADEVDRIVGVPRDSGAAFTWPCPWDSRSGGGERLPANQHTK